MSSNTLFFSALFNHLDMSLLHEERKDFLCNYNHGTKEELIEQLKGHNLYNILILWAMYEKKKILTDEEVDQVIRDYVDTILAE